MSGVAAALADLHRAITAGRDDVRGVWNKHGHVDKRGVASKFFERLSRLETVYSDGHVIGGAEKLAAVTRKFQ